MNATRPNIQKLQAFPEEGRDEVPRASRGGSEPLTAKRDSERPAVFEKLMEEICERRNLEEALRRVRSNKGTPHRSTRFECHSLELKGREISDLSPNGA